MLIRPMLLLPIEGPTCLSFTIFCLKNSITHNFITENVYLLPMLRLPICLASNATLKHKQAFKPLKKIVLKLLHSLV